MIRTLTLLLPLKTFEALHKAAEGRGKTVTVNKADLFALLMDHSRALALLTDYQVELEEGYSNNSAVRRARKQDAS